MLLCDVGQDHITPFGQRIFAVLEVEQVLYTEQADTLTPKLMMFWASSGFGVSADTHLAVLVN